MKNKRFVFFMITILENETTAIIVGSTDAEICQFSYRSSQLVHHSIARCKLTRQLYEKDRMRFIHYYSGITIALFTAVHLFNHLLILHSEDMHLRFMSRARRIYRQPAVEAILLSAVFVQIITGIYLVTAKWNVATDLFQKVQIISGLYLAFFLTVHVRAVMLGRYKLKMDTNLYYGAGVMNMWPQKLFYIPYYSLAIIAIFFHIAAIHKMKMEKLVSADAAKIQSLIIMATGVVVTFFIIYKMSNLKSVVKHLPGAEKIQLTSSNIPTDGYQQ